ncbi:hypothetical protein GGE65_007926 [Skermanella aerolata]
MFLGFHRQTVCLEQAVGQQAVTGLEDAGGTVDLAELTTTGSKASAGSDRSSFGKVRKIIDHGHIGQRDNDTGAVIRRRAAAPPRIHIGTWRSSSVASSTSLLNGVDVTIVPVFARRPGATSSSSAQLHSSAVEQQGYWPATSGLAAPLSEFRIAGSVWNDSAPADPAPSSRARGRSEDVELRFIDLQIGCAYMYVCSKRVRTLSSRSSLKKMEDMIHE